MEKSSANSWQLQDAKARFSEVFRRARSTGPQRITRSGKEEVVLVAAEEFDNLTGRNKPREHLVDVFLNSPLAKAGIPVNRLRGKARRLDL